MTATSGVGLRHAEERRGTCALRRAEEIIAASRCARSRKRTLQANGSYPLSRDQDKRSPRVFSRGTRQVPLEHVRAFQVPS